MRWGIILCTCNETLPIDVKGIGKTLGLERPPVLFSRLPRDEIHSFLSLAARERYDRILIGCCGPRELFTEALAAAGAEGTPTHVVDLRESCYWPHQDREAANAKAARLLRAALQVADQPRAAEHPLTVGGRVLIVTDSPDGLTLARRVGEFAHPTLLLDEASAALDASFVYPLPWKANWGRVAEIRGRLGDFQVIVERTQPIDLETCIYCRKCIPVCHTAAVSEGLRLRLDLCDRCGDCLTACEKVGAIKIPRQDRDVIQADQVVVITHDGAAPGPYRTGHLVLSNPTPADLDAAAWKVYGLVGEFRKPEHVSYNRETCAAGAASFRGCGICIQVCPYEAIDRERERVKVDHFACEGCGACVSACPTSSLTFTEPSNDELYARLAALLAPLPRRNGPERPVVAFHCGEKGQEAFQAAGRLRLPYPASVLPIGGPCLRYFSEANILAAFRMGAAGVALVGCQACPHGERELLYQKVEFARLVLDAFGLGADRLHVITGGTGEEAATVEALRRFAEAVGDPPIRWDGQPLAERENRAVISSAIAAFIAETGREPGRISLDAPHPFAFADVDAPGCTLCRSCVNVCPTHAFRLVEETHTLEFKQLACVACGLCAEACPERVITLKREVFLDRGALDYQPVVQDEMVGCAKCGKPYINRRALEAVEKKVFSMESLLDTFSGNRRNLLRMCPNCRAVVAVLEMQQGWEP